jgi:hypothetical protein
MADEPQNERMDEVLKSVAKKRQDEVGEPFTLHPATRKLLHGEVVRTYGKGAPGSRWSRILTFWRRIGFAVATLAILLTVMLIVIPNQERQAELARTVPQPTATSDGESAGTADFLARDEAKQKKDSFQVKNESESVMVESARRTVEQKQVIKELDGVTLADKPAPSAPAREPMDRKRQESSLAKSSSERAKSAESLLDLRAAEEPAKPGQVPAIAQSGDSNAVMLGVPVHFYSVDTSGVSRARYMQLPAQTPALAGASVSTVQPVLASFEFEQNGDQVRITDADGSVYQGQAITVITNALGDVSGGTLGREVQQVEAGKKLYESQRALEEPQAQYRYFRATGTNRTLRKAVTIEASFPVSQQAQSTSAPAVNAPTSRSDVQRSENLEYRSLQRLPQIRGRAQIGTNQQVLIQAVPAQK